MHTLTATVGDDGVLHLPLGPEAAGRRVRVSVQVVPPPMTQDEWRAAVVETAGKWQGEFEFVPKELPEGRNLLS